MRAESLIRSHIRTMEPYHPVKPFEILAQELGFDADDIIKLDANENPYGALEACRQALANMKYAHIYPDSQSELLVSEIADWLGVDPKHILVGAGADELIDLVMRLVLDPGDAMITCSPTFGMYAFDAGVQGAQVIDIPRKDDFSIDLESLGAAVAEYRPKLLFVASPNNPDGSRLSGKEIEQLLEWPLITVLDEAYVEFASGDVSWIGEVQRRENLIVLRTFSKWAGLAGLRVGYGAFPSSLVPHLQKIKQPYAVSAAAQAAARAAVQSQQELKRVGELITGERSRLFEGLQAIDYLRPYPSEANFILSRVVGADAAEITRELRKRGILIRYFDKPGLRDHIRISVGKPEETQKVLAALKQLEANDA